MSTIWFCRADQPYYEFSNFFKCQFTYEGRVWSSTEHAYQAMKFEDVQTQEFIRSQPNAFMAAKEGRDTSRIIKPNWESELREPVMHDVNWCKYTQNSPLMDLLLSTDERELIELSMRDNYWGTRYDRSGRNRLGILLMYLRDVFRNSN